MGVVRRMADDNAVRKDVIFGISETNVSGQST
jgi:hypothetical protein